MKRYKRERTAEELAALPGSRAMAAGRIEIDTNRVENAIRPLVLGRKKYLFAGSHEAAERAAVL